MDIRMALVEFLCNLFVHSQGISAVPLGKADLGHVTVCLCHKVSTVYAHQ